MHSREKTLGDYVRLLKDAEILLETGGVKETDERPITFITYDSRKAGPNTLFICKGAHFQPAYLQDAVQRGAVAYISLCEYSEGRSIPCLKVVDLRKALALLANYYFEEPWKKLTLIGVTGTKGKSTTAYYIKSILDEYLADSECRESGILSGIENYDGVIREESHLTTPETFELYEHFSNSLSMGIHHLTMEVSSQALKYHRTLGVQFKVGIFLNIGQDHISELEHPDFEDYLDSKLRLFSQCEMALVHNDGPYFSKVLEAAKEGAQKVVTFGRNPGSEIWGHDLVTREEGTEFSVSFDGVTELFQINMKGTFNVDNALAAISACLILEIPISIIKKGLAKAKVAGRMELFYHKNKDRIIFVDYAHNQLSFETLFQSIKQEYPDREISIVFGCPGKKALGRRKELGEIAGRNADKVYITEEDAGEEPLEDISKEIASYVAKEGTPHEMIPDREKAIRKAIQTASAHSVILITGKGRETRQKRGTEYIDTPSDVEIVERVVRDEK